eukprot:1676026-Rhodomonas_salina.1
MAGVQKQETRKGFRRSLIKHRAPREQRHALRLLVQGVRGVQGFGIDFAAHLPLGLGLARCDLLEHLPAVACEIKAVSARGVPQRRHIGLIWQCC